MTGRRLNRIMISGALTIYVFELFPISFVIQEIVHIPAGRKFVKNRL